MATFVNGVEHILGCVGKYHFTGFGLSTKLSVLDIGNDTDTCARSPPSTDSSVTSEAFSHHQLFPRAAFSALHSHTAPSASSAASTY